MSTEQQAARLKQIKNQLQLHKDRGIRLCLGCESEPRLGYSHGEYCETSPRLPYPHKLGQRFEAFTLHCPGCGFKLDGFMNLQAALCEWHRANTPGDVYYAARWAERFEQQMMAKAATTLEH
ncbi:hypothetical protein [Shewanella frigidimarina]|uniref:hypothetical protein n=1 Tax=Shewanella frigidimarina TaxID=56812 RepID=UPI003D7AEA09